MGKSKSNTPTAAIVAATIVLIVIIGIASYLLLNASREISLAIVAGGLSVATLAYTQNQISKREIEARHFIKKSEIYAEVFETIQAMMGKDKGFTESDEDSLPRKLFNIQTKLLIWGGPDVLLAWSGMQEPMAGGVEALAAGRDLLAAMRVEMGHDDKKLGKLGILNVIVRNEEHQELLARLP